MVRAYLQTTRVQVGTVGSLGNHACPASLTFLHSTRTTVYTVRTIFTAASRRCSRNSQCSICYCANALQMSFQIAHDYVAANAHHKQHKFHQSCPCRKHVP